MRKMFLGVLLSVMFASTAMASIPQTILDIMKKHNVFTVYPPTPDFPMGYIIDTGLYDTQANFGISLVYMNSSEGVLDTIIDGNGGIILYVSKGDHWVLEYHATCLAQSILNPILYLHYMNDNFKGLTTKQKHIIVSQDVRNANIDYSLATLVIRNATRMLSKDTSPNLQNSYVACMYDFNFLLLE